MFPLIRSCSLVAVVVVALNAGTGPQLQAADPSSGGVDFLLLVDVSRSMVQSRSKVSEANGIKDGTDPERIRWDATKLLLDLLGPSDRLMIRRFNHGVPPIYSDGGVTQDDESMLKKLAQHEFFQPWLKDLQGDLVPLTQTRRGELAADIAGFNRTDDELGKTVGYLDVGGTRIVSALRTTAERLRGSTRPLHVIVLTDGRDDQYATYKNNDAALRQALQFYLGETAQALAPGVKVPVHCIGLNLKGEDSNGEPEAADQARDLLRRISKLTGGTFEEVDDSSGLMRFFQCLTRQLRRYWVEELIIPAGDERIEQTHVTNGLSELTVLSYQRASQKSRKYAIEPTATEIGREWVGLDALRHEAPQSESVRTGKPRPGDKSATLYRCYYYGPTLESGETLGSSPFRKFQPNDGVQLKLTLPASPTEQRLVLFKGTTQPLFDLASPKAGARFSRYEKLIIRVSMLSRAHFLPENFSLTATITAASSRKALGGELGRSIESCSALTAADEPGGQSSVTTLPLKYVAAGSAGYFEGEVLLAGLPRGEGLVDDYELRVTAFGLESPAHALSRNRFELLPRLFEVENTLQLNPVETVELSTDPEGQIREFVIQTSVPTAGEIPLDLKFDPPTLRGAETPLPGSHFKVEHPGKPGALVLTDGRAQVRVTLTDPLPMRGMPYLAGGFTVTHAPGIRMDSLKVPLKLRLDLARIQFVSAPAELDAKSALTISDPITLRLDPDGQIKSSDKQEEVTVRLKFLGPADPLRKDASDFSDSELWLEAQGQAAGQREIKVKVGDADRPGTAFRIHIAPKSMKTPMKYRCRLEVDGNWIDSVTHEFLLNKDAPAIEVDTPLIRVAIGRGLPRRVQLGAWLKGLPGEKSDVHFEKIVSGEPLVFLATNDQKSAPCFPVKGPDASSPVTLMARTETDPASIQELNLDIAVPLDTPYGTYRRDLVLVGKNVTEKRVTLEVVVNGLELDVQRTARATETDDTWESASSKRVIQLLNASSRRSFRIRTGLGMPLSADDFAIEVEGPFRDNDGDTVSGKITVSPLRVDQERKTAQFDVDLPPTKNRNDSGKPYSLHLKVHPQRKVAKPGEDLYVDPVEFEFQVYFFDRREILGVQVIPLK